MHINVCMYVCVCIYIYIHYPINQIVGVLAMNIIRDHNFLFTYPFVYVFIFYLRTLSVAQN